MNAGAPVKSVVFDIGGTLMEYRDMPYVWFDYYAASFERLNAELSLGLGSAQIERSLKVLKDYNPGINYREEDYPPEKIFGDVTAGWNTDIPLKDIIKRFFCAMDLKALIYPESAEVLKELKQRGLIVGTYTNVVSGMPDEMHKSYFSELLPYFDIYVSSCSCGFRKPNPRGLEVIAEKFRLSPDEMIFVGDEKKDPETARRFGCRSVLVNRSEESRKFGQDFTVKSLTELLDGKIIP